MTLAEFKSSLTESSPPVNSNRLLQALWQDAQGDWDTAHRLAQSVTGPEGAWVHAYLHRKEGDLSNAAYWYSRANKPVSDASLETEWEQLVVAFLE